MGNVGLSEISDKFSVPQQKATCSGYKKNGTYAFKYGNFHYNFRSMNSRTPFFRLTDEMLRR